MLEIPESKVMSQQIEEVLAGKRIVKEAYLGGAIYFCPVCQPLVQ